MPVRGSSICTTIREKASCVLDASAELEPGLLVSFEISALEQTDGNARCSIPGVLICYPVFACGALLATILCRLLNTCQTAVSASACLQQAQPGDCLQMHD